jgi:LEA14-like dessication related protein
MRPRRLALALTPLLALVLSGCGLFIQNPVVAITDVRLAGVGLTGGTAEVFLEIDNPNRFDVNVWEVQYTLFVADRPDAVRWDTLAVGVSTDEFMLAKNSIQVVPIRIPFRYPGIGTALRGLLFGGEVPYRVEGTIRAKGLGVTRRLPFAASGTLGLELLDALEALSPPAELSPPAALHPLR